MTICKHTGFDYAAAAVRVNERIANGELPKEALPVSGYPFAIRRTDAVKFRACNQGQDWFKACDGNWYNCHVLHPNMMAQAQHYGCTLYADRGCGPASARDIERSHLD